jgi:gluconokinase
MVKVIIIGGTAGTGKSTIGNSLSGYFQCEFIEGDELHPQQNIDKMANGIPLTDDDRWSWLSYVSIKSTQEAQNSRGISVVSCSALKRVYRDQIQKTSPETQFIYLFLYASMDELIKRIEARPGHFMKSAMLESQFEALQLPKDEPNALCINVEGRSVEDITQLGIQFVESH